MKCRSCGVNDTEFNRDDDLWNDLCERADALGGESLTENEQHFLNSDLCSECV